MSERQAPPSFYNDLEETLAESWRLIARGVADRRSAFHHPTVATIGSDGGPRLRTVILRGCDPAGRLLRFHTDLRSEKVAEITREPRVALHFYNPEAKIQLRLDGEASLNADSPVADLAWAGSRVFSRQCYGIEPGPGSKIVEAGAFALPDTTDDATAAGRANFCAVTIRITRLEWLYLANTGHRRADFLWEGEIVRGQWLVP